MSTESPIKAGLMERRTVVLEGDITQGSIDEVCSRLLDLQTQSDETITLLIESKGGNLYPALQLCDQIKIIMTAPVRGIATGECSSSATIIMLHCAERFATPYSRFLIHSGNLEGLNVPVGRTSSKIAKQLFAEVSSTEKQVVDIYVNYLTPKQWTKKGVSKKQKKKFVQSLFDRGDQAYNERMSAEEAVTAGLIEKVLYEKLDIY